MFYKSSLELVQNEVLPVSTITLCQRTFLVINVHILVFRHCRANLCLIPVGHPYQSSVASGMAYSYVPKKCDIKHTGALVSKAVLDISLILI